MKQILLVIAVVMGQSVLAEDPDLELNLLATGIREGMEMTIAQDGRVFLAERPGKVKLWHPDRPGELTELIDPAEETNIAE